MKNLKMLMLFLSVSMFLSCTNSSDEDLGLTGEGTLTAKIDGQDWASLKATVGAVVTNGVLAVQGSTSNGEFIRINISNYNGIGTYKTGDNLSNVNSISYGTISPIATWMSTFNIGSGTIEITGDTATNVTGTFSFTGLNASAGNSTKTISEGTFNAPK